MTALALKPWGDRLRKAFAGRFTRGVAVLAIGTVAGQALMVLVLPLLTRLYTPEAFGVLGVYLSLLLTLTVAACLRLDMAISLPETDADAFNTAMLALIAGTFFALAVAAVTVFAGNLVLTWTGQPGLAPYLWMLPVGLWFSGVYSALQSWSMRKQRVGLVAKTQVTRAAGCVTLQAGLGVASPSPFGLLFGHLAYMGLGSAGMAAALWRHDRQLFSALSFRGIWTAACRFVRFPLYSVPESLLNAAAVYMPLLLVTAHAGAHEGGCLLLAQRIGAIPVSVFGRNMSKLYLAEAGTRHRSGELGAFTRRLLLQLFKLGVLPFLAMMLAAPLLFPLLFGAEWHRAGVMAAWLAPAMLVQFIVSPATPLLHATGRLATAFFLQLGGFTVVVGATALAGRFAEGWVFETFAIAALAFYLVYLAVLIQASRAIQRPGHAS